MDTFQTLFLLCGPLISAIYFYVTRYYLKNQFKNLKTNYDEIVKNNQELSNEKISLKETNSKFAKEKEDLRKQLDNTKQILVNNKDLSEKKVNELNKKINQNSENEKHLTSQVNSLKTNYDIIVKNNQELTKEKVSLKEINSKFSKEKEDIKKQLENTKQILVSNNDLSEKNLNELNEKFQKSSENEKHLTSQVNSLKNNYEIIVKNNQELTKEKEDIMKQLENTKQILVSNNDLSEKNLNELNEKFQKSSENEKHLTSQVNSLKTNYDITVKNNQELTKEKVSLKEINSKFAKEKEDIMKKLENTKQILVSNNDLSEKNLNELNEKFKKSSENEKHLTYQVNSLKAQFNEAVKNNKELTKENENINQINSKLVQEKENLIKQLEEASKRSENEKSEGQKQLETLKQFTEQIHQDFFKKVDEYQKLMAFKEQSLNEYNEKIQTLFQKDIEQQQQISSLQDTNGELQKNNQGLTKEKVSLKEINSKFAKEKEDIMKQLENTKQILVSNNDLSEKNLNELNEKFKKNSENEKHLTSQSNSLKAYYNEAVKNNQELTKENENINQINSKLVQEKENLIKQLEEASKRSENEKSEGQKQLETLKQNTEQIQEDFFKKADEYQNLMAFKEQSLNELNEKIQTLFQKDIEQQQYISSLQDTNGELQKNNQELTKKFQICDIENNKKISISELKKDESQYGYDIIIQIKSVFDLQQHETCQDNEMPGMKFNQYNKSFDSDQENVIVVGVQGLRNRGKTFIMNLLQIAQFPSDFHFSTPGLCAKLIEFLKKKIIYIDSEGLGGPISVDYKNNKHYQTFLTNKKKKKIIDKQSQNFLNKDITDRYYDIKVTEQIQQEFIIQNSNILIIAISQVTLEDQKLIQSISEQFNLEKDQKSQKKIIVVHNLKDYYRLEYVKEYMDNLQNNFPVEELTIDSYADQQNEEHCNTILIDQVNSDIHHVVMGHQDSEAGRYYNRFALYYIKLVIGTYGNLQTFNIREKLQDYLNQDLKNYIEIKKNQQSDEDQQNASSDKEFLDFCEKSQKIMLKKDYKIEKIKELQVNILGSLYKNCSYSIVYSHQNKNQETHLFVEMPGKVSYKKWFDKPNGKFNLKIIQEKELEENEGEISATTRCFDEKIVCIQICKEKEMWNYEDQRDVNFQNGVYKFVFVQEQDKGYI